jgi:hypothetical protein
MKHEKTFEAIDKLKDIEIELHRLKNALELANKALDAKREWKKLSIAEIENVFGGDMNRQMLRYAIDLEKLLEEKNL